jgi:hypothetical protein
MADSGGRRLMTWARLSTADSAGPGQCASGPTAVRLMRDRSHGCQVYACRVDACPRLPAAGHQRRRFMRLEPHHRARHRRKVKPAPSVRTPPALGKSAEQLAVTFITRPFHRIESLAASYPMANFGNGCGDGRFFEQPDFLVRGAAAFRVEQCLSWAAPANAEIFTVDLQGIPDVLGRSGNEIDRHVGHIDKTDRQLKRAAQWTMVRIGECRRNTDW